MEHPLPPASPRRAGRDALVLGGLVMAALAAFAWRYYLERTACFDSAFFSWMLIDEHTPQSVLGRYGSWLPQLIPVWMVRSGAPLELVLRTYSLCFIGFHAIVLAVIAFALRDRRGAIALPITLVAGFHYMFYYGISELYQGLSLTVLLWALVRRYLEATGPRGRWAWGIAAGLVDVWASFYHQLLVLPLVFFLVHEGLAGARWKQRSFLLLSGVLVGWYVVRIAVMPVSDYEQARMPRAGDLWQYALRLGELGSTQHLLMVWTKFKSLLLLIALAGGALVLQRRWLQALWAVLFSAGFLVLTLITDRDGGSPTIYENYYPVLGLVWALVFADAFLAPGMRWPGARLAAWSVVLLLGLVQIQRGHHRISYKVAYMQRVTTFLRDHGIRKAYGDMANFPWTYALGHWPLGMETALVSGIDGPTKATSLFITADTAQVTGLLDDPNTFLAPSWAPTWFTVDHLDHAYFDLTGGHYERVNTDGAERVWPTLGAEAITLAPPAAPVRLVHDRFTVVEVPITNRGPRTLPSRWSATVPLRLSCKVLRMDGSLYQESQGSALELDLPPGSTYPQGFLIERPSDAGTYRVRTELTAHDSLLGPATEFTIEVSRFGL
ncbi:MAG: hypothetical protein JST66_12490 [Bacteroidetes bacterium]|nr:hypothetical protein [Bacteroidota bacterium]